MFKFIINLILDLLCKHKEIDRTEAWGSGMGEFYVHWRCKKCGREGGNSSPYGNTRYFSDHW